MALGERAKQMKHLLFASLDSTAQSRREYADLQNNAPLSVCKAHSQHRRLACKTKYDVEDYSFGKTQTDDADVRQEYCRCRMFLLCGNVRRGVPVCGCSQRLL